MSEAPRSASGTDDGGDADGPAFTPSIDHLLDTLTDWNYTTIHRLRKMLGRQYRVQAQDFLANTPDKDPFYSGPQGARPRTLAWSKWIGDLWPRLGFTTRAHDRRIHYKLMSLGDVVMPEGKVAGRPYDHANQGEGWEYLMFAVKNARYLHYIPYDAIEDQRNPEAQQFYRPDMWPEPSIAIADGGTGLALNLPGVPEPPGYFVRDYATPSGYLALADKRQIANQRYHLEVWVEKTTQNDILEPWCREHGAVFVTASGQMTLTGAWEAAERIRKHGKPAVLFYISDFDGSGQSMPLAIARKLERFWREEYAKQNPPPVILQQVALTYQQVKDYSLPDMPTDDKPWLERYHIGTAELDALEVYHPGSLRQLLDQAAVPYWDATLGRRIANAEQTLSNALYGKETEIIGQHQESLDGLRERWETACEEARKLLEPVWEALQEEHAAIAQELKEAQPDIDDYPVPEAAQADRAAAKGMLFDSRRTYWQQLRAYQRYKQEHGVTDE